jgi:phage portal protein BeeE
MTTQDNDPFTEQMTQALRDGRIKVVGGEDRPAVDDTTDQLRSDIEQAMRPTVDQVIANAIAPWRKLTFWLLTGYGVMCVLSIVQFVLWMVTR